MQNVEGAAGTYEIDLTASDNLRLTGETHLSVELAKGASHDWRVGIQGLAVGEGSVDHCHDGAGRFCADAARSICRCGRRRRRSARR